MNMYPDVVFFGPVRDPINLYENHRRDKPPASVSPDNFFYGEMINKVQAGADRESFYHILQFKDILSDPVQTIRKVYSLAGLDISGFLICASKPSCICKQMEVT